MRLNFGLFFLLVLVASPTLASFVVSSQHQCGTGIYTYSFSNGEFGADYKVRVSQSSYGADYSVRIVQDPNMANLVLADNLDGRNGVDMKVCKISGGGFSQSTKIYVSSDMMASSDITVHFTDSPNATYSLFINSAYFNQFEAAALFGVIWKSNALASKQQPLTSAQDYTRIMQEANKGFSQAVGSMFGVDTRTTAEFAQEEVVKLLQDPNFNQDDPNSQRKLIELVSLVDKPRAAQLAAQFAEKNKNINTVNAQAITRKAPVEDVGGGVDVESNLANASFDILNLQIENAKNARSLVIGECVLNNAGLYLKMEWSDRDNLGKFRRKFATIANLKAKAENAKAVGAKDYSKISGSYLDNIRILQNLARQFSLYAVSKRRYDDSDLLQQLISCG
jgi:hypothetical protein